MPDNCKIQCDSVIFDVDGTLWDCTETAAKAYNAAIAESSGPDHIITAEDLRHNFGKPMEEIAEKLFTGVSPEERRKMMLYTAEREDLLLQAEKPAPYPGVPEVLKELSVKYPLFIISNCQPGYIERFLQLTGLGGFITDHYCPGDTGKLKAGNIVLMSERHHLASPVYVGDTRGDEIACEEAGVPLIYAAYGFGKTMHPAAVISSFSDLLCLL